MMAQKPILRLASVEFGEAIKRSKDGDGINGGPPEGLFVGMMDTFDNLFAGKFNTTWIWVPRYEKNDFYGSQKSDGSWTGILGLMERNESDVFPFPLPIPQRAVKENIVNPGPVIMSSPMVIISVFKEYTASVQVLDQWFNYPPDLIILFLITLLILVQLQTKFSNNTKYHLKHFFDFISMIFYQGFPNCGTIPSTVLITIVAIGIFFWMNIWSNLVSTDMIVSDDRYVIRSVDDLIRLDTQTVMFENDPAFAVIRERTILEPGSNWDKVFRKTYVFGASNVSGRIDTRKRQKELWESGAQTKIKDGRIAWITIEQIVMLSEVPFCSTFNTSVILLSKDKFVTAPFTAWFRKSMEPSMERKVTRIFRLTAEAGMAIFILNQIKDVFDREVEARVESLRRCFEPNIDLFMQGQSIPDTFDENVIPPITISMMDQVFYLFICGMMLPMVILLYEITFNRLDQERKKQRKEQIYVAIRSVRQPKE